MQSVVVFGRRWTDSFGNTYHSASVVVDGAFVGRAEGYGYGDQYEETAARLLEKEGLILGRPEYSTGGKQVLWAFLNDMGVKYYRESVDVPRKKDL